MAITNMFIKTPHKTGMHVSFTVAGFQTKNNLIQEEGEGVQFREWLFGMSKLLSRDTGQNESDIKYVFDRICQLYNQHKIVGEASFKVNGRNVTVKWQPELESSEFGCYDLELNLYVWNYFFNVLLRGKKDTYNTKQIHVCTAIQLMGHLSDIPASGKNQLAYLGLHLGKELVNLCRDAWAGVEIINELNNLYKSKGIENDADYGKIIKRLVTLVYSKHGDNDTNITHHPFNEMFDKLLSQPIGKITMPSI